MLAPLADAVLVFLGSGPGRAMKVGQVCRLSHERLIGSVVKVSLRILRQHGGKLRADGDSPVFEQASNILLGRDSAFGRALKDKKGNTLSEAFDKGPYYAVELHPSLLNTQGGPRKNVHGQVLDLYGRVIEGLYVAGELGSMWGPIYQGACNNAEALVFGRRAISRELSSPRLKATSTYRYRMTATARGHRNSQRFYSRRPP